MFFHILYDNFILIVAILIIDLVVPNFMSAFGPSAFVQTLISSRFIRYFLVTEYLYRRAIHLFVHNNLHPKIEFADLRNI